VAIGLLILDDDPDVHAVIEPPLKALGYRVWGAQTAADGLERLRAGGVDVLLCDIGLPDANGLDVLDQVARESPATISLIISAARSQLTAIEALRRGAADYLLKPLDLDEVTERVNRAAELAGLQHELRRLRRAVSRRGDGDTLIGKSDAMAQIRSTIQAVAGTRTTVLIRGETGSGKEAVARALHAAGAEPGPFVAVNCAAIPEAIFESELFGHARGAFTGADRDRAGLIEEADGGTLFLDEVGELPLALQAKLLRVLEAKAVTRLGTSRPIPVDLRIVTATNRTLDDEVAAGRFRGDLYYRLRVIEIEVPPLRARRDDIPSLVEFLLTQINAELKRHIVGVSSAALQLLGAHAWPGNVRELRNALERAAILTTGNFLEPQDFTGLAAAVPVRYGGAAASGGAATAAATAAPYDRDAPDNLSAYLAACERDHIAAILARVNGSRTRAAELLGIDRSTLHRKLHALGLADG